MAQLTVRVLLLALAGLSLAQAQVNNSYLIREAVRVTTINHTDEEFGERNEQEWEGYDGWYNNPAHPEWGGAGKSLAAARYYTRAFLVLYLASTFPPFRRPAHGEEDAGGVRGRSLRASRRKQAQRYAHC